MMREEKQKILDMVANGSITPEEAIMLLECLEGLEGETKESPSIQEVPSETVMPISMKVDSPKLDSAPQKSVEDEVVDSVPPVTEPGDGGERNAPPPQYAENPDFTWENEPELPMDRHRYSYTIPEADIHNIKISWINGPVVVKAYGGKDIQVAEYSKFELSPQDSLYITVINGALQIKWDQNDRLMSLARMIGKSFLSKHLVVEVPFEMAAKLSGLHCTNISGGMYCTQFAAQKIKLSSTSGKIFAAGLNAEGLNIDSVSGSIHMNECAAETIMVSSTSGAVFSEGYTANIAGYDTISGRITTRGKAAQFKSNTVSGKIQAFLYAMPIRVKMDSISGRVMLAIPKNEGFSVKYSSLSGILQSDFPLAGNMGQKSGQATFGNGATEIDLNTLSGRMQIYRLD